MTKYNPQWEVNPVVGKVLLTCYNSRSTPKTEFTISLDPKAATELAEVLYEAVEYLKDAWPKQQRVGVE